MAGLSSACPDQKVQDISSWETASGLRTEYPAQKVHHEYNGTPCVNAL